MLSDQELDLAAENRDLAPNLIKVRVSSPSHAFSPHSLTFSHLRFAFGFHRPQLQLDASIDALGLALIDEGGHAGRPQELLHAAMRKVSPHLPRMRVGPMGRM